MGNSNKKQSNKTLPPTASNVVLPPTEYNVVLPPTAYNVVFLDIDGVLNNAQSDVSDLCVIENDLKNIIVDFVKKHSNDQTHTVIVISSTWRYTKTTRDKYMGIFGTDAKYIVSCTQNYGSPRPYEVVSWLEGNTDFNVKEKYSLKYPLDAKFDHKFPEQSAGNCSPPSF